MPVAAAIPVAWDPRSKPARDFARVTPASMMQIARSHREANTRLGHLRYWGLAALTLAQAHPQHPEQAEHSIKGLIPVRKTAPNFLPDAVLKRDPLSVSP